MNRAATEDAHAESDRVFKALADPTRRRILDLLLRRPRATGQIAARFPGVTRFAVMKHLKVLEAAGLVVTARRGRRRMNHLNAAPLQRVYRRWIRPYEARWADALLDLKETAEREDTDE